MVVQLAAATVPEMTPEQVTNAWLSQTLDDEVQIRSQQRIGDGLVGMNLRLELDGSPRSPHSVVVKLPSPDPTSRATGNALRNYEREVKFYNELAGTLDVRAPRCYHAEWHEADGDFVIVLEDLAPGEQGDQIRGCSAEMARTAVLELAKLHGPRWGDPTLDQIEWLSRRTSADDTALLAMMWSMMYPGFLAIYRQYLDDESHQLIERFGARISEWVDGRIGPATVTHGDYRLDNLMFATAAGGAEIAVVDWQSPGHGPAMGDVSYFLGAGPLPEVRRDIEVDLVKQYAQALRTDYNIEIDDDWAWRQYRREAFAGVVMAVIASQLVGGTERSEAMFAAMATRHAQHALDLSSEECLAI